MMREVTGAFFGSRRVDEALEDLKAEGIAGDRIRVAEIGGFADFQTCMERMERSASAPTQWITAEYTFDERGYPMVDASHDDILPSLDYDDSDAHAHALMRLIVSIRDDVEMRAVCDIFSRLGTDDIDAESTVV
jgi:hypothetical protein